MCFLLFDSLQLEAKQEKEEKTLKNILTERENENWNAERRRNREEKLN